MGSCQVMFSVAEWTKRVLLGSVYHVHIKLISCSDVYVCYKKKDCTIRHTIRNDLDLQYSHTFIYSIRCLLLLTFGTLAAIVSENSIVFTFSFRKA